MSYEACDIMKPDTQMMRGCATHHILFHKILISLQKESNFYTRLHKNTAGIHATLGRVYVVLVKNSNLLKLVLLTGKVNGIIESYNS